MRGNFTTDRRGEKNPNYKHGGKGTRLFSIWANMKSRCYNPNADGFEHYGGRGITVCGEWHDYMTFKQWAIANGYEEHLTLDRIDVNGNYTPSNCRWVTVKVQSNNRRNNHYVTIDNVQKTLFEWCVIYNINYRTVQDRLRRGWSYTDALQKPVQTKFRRVVS